MTVSARSAGDNTVENAVLLGTRNRTGRYTRHQTIPKGNPSHATMQFRTLSIRMSVPGSNCDMAAHPCHVRFAPNSCRTPQWGECEDD